MGEWPENLLADDISRVLFLQLKTGTGDDAHRQETCGSFNGPAYCDRSSLVLNLSSTIKKSAIQQNASSNSYEEDTSTPTPTESQASLRKSYQAILAHPVPNPNILDLQAALPRSLVDGDQKTTQKETTTIISRSTTKLGSSNHRKRPTQADEKDEESSNHFKRRKELGKSSTHQDPSARWVSPRKFEYACPFYRNNPSDPELRGNCRTQGVNTDKLKYIYTPRLFFVRSYFTKLRFQYLENTFEENILDPHNAPAVVIVGKRAVSQSTRRGIHVVSVLIF